MTLCHSWQPNPHLSYEHSAGVVQKIGAICIVGCGYHQWRSCELKVSHIYTDQEYRPCSVVVYLLLYTVYWAHTVYILTFLSLHSRADIIRFIHFGCVWLNWIELWCGMVWCGVVWCGVVWALVSECQCVCTHECACCLWMTVSKDARCQWPSCT